MPFQSDPEQPWAALDESLRQQAEIVKQVERIGWSQRRTRQIMAGLAVLAAVAAIIGFVALGAASSARRANESVAAVTVEARVTACQVRNNAARETRRAIDRNSELSYERIHRLLNDLKAAFPSDRLNAFIDSELAIPLEDVTPPDTEIDSDCDMDGAVTEADYPPVATLKS